MVSKNRFRLAMAPKQGVDLRKSKQRKQLLAAVPQKKVQTKRSSCIATNENHPTGREFSENGIKLGENGRDRVADPGKDAVTENSDEQNSRYLNVDVIDDSDTSESSNEVADMSPHLPFNGMKKSLWSVADDDKDTDAEVPLSDLEELDEDRGEFLPHARLTINNTSALQTALARISIFDKSTSFASHQSVDASADTAENIPDASDDLHRELSFYSQSLDAARRGRCELLAEGVPFSRPKDYFAEMVKQDSHMDMVKAKLVEEASAKKSSLEARKLRELKKFGKQIRVAKLQERQQMKRETLDKLKTLRRKRQDSAAESGINEADMFDVSIDNEATKKSQRGVKGRPRSDVRMPNPKRLKKNEKYGFGGKKRHSKSGDSMSSGDLWNFDVKSMKTDGVKGRRKSLKISRPGRAKRRAMAAR